MKRRSYEKKMVSFSDYWTGIDGTPDLDLPDRNALPVDLPLLVEETKIHCMMAMLLCLDRRRRPTFIPGEIFGVSDVVGGEILGIKRDTFRKRLSRARRQVDNFMTEKCGLIRSENPCHCHRKTKAMMDHGGIDPEQLIFNSNFIFRVKSISEERYHRFNSYPDSECYALFKDHPLQESPDFVRSLRDVQHSRGSREIVHIDPDSSH